MPLGIVSEEDFNLEKEKYHPPSSVGKVIDVERGRGNSPEVPNEFRKIIGEEGIVDRSEALALAASFNISPSSVSAYRNGSTSTASYSKPEQGLINHIDKVKGRISKKARNIALIAMDSITEDKLKETKPVEAANIARYMSAIIKDMEPEREKEEQRNGPIFQIYAPQFKSEESFETIYSRE